jgi:hypothetical protein
MPSSEDADDGGSGSSAPQAAPVAAAAASGVFGAAVNTGIAPHHSQVVSGPLCYFYGTCYRFFNCQAAKNLQGA